MVTKVVLRGRGRTMCPRNLEEQEVIQADSLKDAQMRRGMFAEMLRQVRRVPRGKVATYGDVAYAAGYPGAARQVAWALHQEHGDLPWQRIVGAGGAILCTGELGFEQRLRLKAEGVSFLGLKVNMAAHHHSFYAQEPAKRKSARGARSKQRNDR
jgi:methylated-DNA-protein-cysteine methyltransferase-like protein